MKKTQKDIDEAEEKAMAYMATRPSYCGAESHNSYVAGYTDAKEQGKDLVKAWFDMFHFSKIEDFPELISKSLNYLGIEPPKEYTLEEFDKKT